jgi:hypothetical protein
MTGREKTGNAVMGCRLDDSMLDTELFVRIAQLALLSGTRWADWHSLLAVFGRTREMELDCDNTR